MTVTGVDDTEDDGDVTYTIVAGAAVSADQNYDTVDPSDVAVTNLDVDTVGPTATLTDATGPEAPQVGDPIVVTITFDEEPLGFTDDDLIVGGTAGATGGTLTGGPLEWTFTIPAVSEPGTVTVSLPPGVVFDAAENPNTASEPLTVTVEAAPATTTTTTTSTTTTTTTPTTTTAPTTTVAPTAPTSSLVGELPATGSGPGSVMPYALLLLGAGILALLIASTRRRQSAGPTV